MAYRAKGEPERAVPDYDLFLKINPNDAVAYHSRGLAYRDLRDYDRAIRDFDQVISSIQRLSPRSTTAVWPIPPRETPTGPFATTTRPF